MKNKNKKTGNLKLLMIFLGFEVWVKDFKIFALRFGFLVKKCMDFTPGIPPVNKIPFKVLNKEFIRISIYIYV